ncbi:hypothetical protein PybrP1_001803 [[Pythium] brassicae (nom. inval.)]|nr:hypothetical protein PybrP1_001803 [[Pythium] brassicae (nom. inval.)]
MSAEQSLELQQRHQHNARQQHPMYGVQLPPLTPNLPTLPMRLPSLKHAAVDRTPPSPASSGVRSATSSPRSSPATTLSGMKRLRVESLTIASVHPSAPPAAAAAGAVAEYDDLSAKSDHSPTKRERRFSAADSDDIFISGSYKAARPPALNATHELRALRHDAAQMQFQLEKLRSHWRDALPAQGVLLRACEAAKAKWVTSQAEALNRQLKEQLLQQQLYLASLQSLVLQSPFLAMSRSKEVFDALHTPLSLADASLSDRQRRELLSGLCDRSTRMAPAVADRFLCAYEARATVAAPFSHSSVMSDGAFTYASTLLVCRVPHASLRAVAAAVEGYFAALQREVRAHAGVVADFGVLEQLSASSRYAQLRYANGPDFRATSNTTFAARVDERHAVFAVDFVDDDPRFPVRRAGDGDVDADGATMRHTCLSLVLSPAVDAHSGEPHVLLRRVLVTRYDLPPSARLVHHDVKTTRQWTNGDLLLKVVCQELEQQRRQGVTA